MSQAFELVTGVAASRRTESWMQESGESSSALQLSSSSGRVAGMTGEAHEVSSSGASSRSQSRQEKEELWMSEFLHRRVPLRCRLWRMQGILAM